MTTWAVAGAAFTPDDARAETFKSTSGARGVTLPGDLKVTALPVPGASVRIAPGGATLPNRYLGASGGGQSYGTRQAASEDLAIPATGSGAGATRYVIQRITDPQYEGQVPVNPTTHRYDTFAVVDSITNLTYPFVELARIDQPANTATITQAMITDLRKLANPRELTVVKPRPTLAAPLTLDAMEADGEPFPGILEWMDIPEWATHAQISADWISVFYPAGTGHGEHWVEFGPYLRLNTHTYSTARTAWDAATNADPYRVNWRTVDEVPVAAGIRGTNQPFFLKGRVLGGAGYATMGTASGTFLQVRFVERI